MSAQADSDADAKQAKADKPAPADEAAEGEEADEESADDKDANKDAEEGNNEEKDADPKMSAASFNGWANGVTVNVEASEGAFPEGTTMNVSSAEIAENIDAVESYVNKGAAATAQAYSLSLGCYLNELHPMP